MQFVFKKKSLLTGERKPDQYAHTLQFYKHPPVDSITLEEFEKLALERLQALRIIERAGIKFRKNSNEYREVIFAELKKQNLSYFYKTSYIDEDITDAIYDERRKDHISHFILRLAYCRREELRRWFISQEVDLFKMRFKSENIKNMKTFMESNNMDYKPIEDSERDKLINQLMHGIMNSANKIKTKKFYRVPFVEVLDLIRNRSVYLQDGYAYIPESELVSIVTSAYRAHLSHALAVTSRALPHLEEDGRLINMLSMLHQRYIGIDYTHKQMNNAGDVSPEMIDNLSKSSFPLCMVNLHETLRKNHHLKYNGRLQYGLFLKGIGMTLEDALRFWRSEFSKHMDIDKFDKQYAYNIRYNYGKEGKRTNFSPYNCMKIIMSNNPGPGEVHGCPYKHSDKNSLKQQLQNLKISAPGIKSILELVDKGHYQIACTRHFEVTHNEVTVSEGISHPNKYFEESQKIHKGLNKEERCVANVSTTRAVLYGNEETSTSKATEPSDELDMSDDFPVEDIEELLKGV